MLDTLTQAAETGHLYRLNCLVAEHVGVQFHFDAGGVEQTDGSLRCTSISLVNLIFPTFMLIIEADIALIDDGGMLQVPHTLSKRRFRRLEAVHLKRRRIHVGDGRRAGDESFGVDGTVYILLRLQFRFTRGACYFDCATDALYHVYASRYQVTESSYLFQESEAIEFFFELVIYFVGFLTLAKQSCDSVKPECFGIFDLLDLGLDGTAERYLALFPSLHLQADFLADGRGVLSIERKVYVEGPPAWTGRGESVVRLIADPGACQHRIVRAVHTNERLVGNLGIHGQAERHVQVLSQFF